MLGIVFLINRNGHKYVCQKECSEHLSQKITTFILLRSIRNTNYAFFFDLFAQRLRNLYKNESSSNNGSDYLGKYEENRGCNVDFVEYGNT